MLLSDSDLAIVSAVNASGSFLTNQSVRTIAHRLQSEEGTSAAVRSNFIVDSSTPHGDAIIVDRSVMKPALGWVTAHTTESLRTGLHEWCIKVEHQGETSDGSGLMLGIVPKNFSRFDSFISQGGGWCLSRAGKFYGHWRRVDNNTSVSSLTFSTGDKVIFELDLDANRMTVRVGEKFVTGEISNLSGEVYPAVSLHYRHQHVRFEYHKVHDRSKKKASWIDRGCFPNAVCFLSLETAKEILQQPLPHYLFSKSLTAGPESPIGTSLTQQGSSSLLENFALKVMIVSRAVALFQRMLLVSSSASIGYTRHIYTPIKDLRRAAQHQSSSSSVQTLLQALLPYRASTSHQQQAMLSSGGAFTSVASSFAGDCGAILMLQAVAQQSAASPMVLGSLPLIVQFLAKGEPFSLSEISIEQGRSISLETTQAVADRVYSLLTPSLNSIELPKELRPSVIELLVALSIQRGSVSDAMRAIRLLLAAADEMPDICISEGTSRWVRQLYSVLKPSRQLLTVSAAGAGSLTNTSLFGVSERVLLTSSAMTNSLPSSPTSTKDALASEEIYSSASDGEWVYFHSTKGIRHWLIGSTSDIKTIPINVKDITECLSPQPGVCAKQMESLQWAQPSSMCCDGSFVYWAPIKLGSTSTTETEDGAGGAKGKNISTNAVTNFMESLVILCFDKKTLKPARVLTGSILASSVDLAPTLAAAATSDGDGGALWRLRLIASPKAVMGAGGFMMAVQYGNSGQIVLVHVPQSSLDTSASSPNSLLKPLWVAYSLPAPSYHHALSLTASTRVTLINSVTLRAAEQSAPRGQLSIELWFQLRGRCEPQALLKCGDKTQQGELFIDLAVIDGTFSVRGGYRHDTRGAHIVAVPLPPSEVASFHHISLSYDGKWRLLLDGSHEVAARATQQPSMEKPLTGLQLGGGFSGLVTDLRIWRVARSSYEISRDCYRALQGDEAGLWLHWPLCEADGALAYDHSQSGFHGIIRRADDPTLHARVYLSVPRIARSIFHSASNFTTADGSVTTPNGRTLIPNLEEANMVWDNARSLLLIRSEGLLHAHQLAISQSENKGPCVASLEDIHLTQLLEPRLEPSKPNGTINVVSPPTGTITVLQFNEEGMLAIITKNGKGSDVTEEADGTSGLTHITFGSAQPLLHSPLEAQLCSRADWSDEARPLSLPSTAYALMVLMEFCCERFGVTMGTKPSNSGPLVRSSPFASQVFLPFVNDVSVDCLWSIVGLIRDHFRQLQVRNAPKTHNLRNSEISVPVLTLALQCLDHQIDAATKNKIHPSVLDLEISDEGLSTAAGAGTASPMIPISLNASIASGDFSSATPSRQPRFASGTVHHSPSLQQQMSQSLLQALNGAGQQQAARALFASEGIDEHQSTTIASKSPQLGQYILATLSELVQASSALQLPSSLTTLAASIISRCIPHHYVLPTRRAALLLGLLRGQSPPPPQVSTGSRSQLSQSLTSPREKDRSIPGFLTSSSSSPALIIGLVESIADVESCAALCQGEPLSLMEVLITTLCQESKTTTVALLKMTDAASSLTNTQLLFATRFVEVSAKALSSLQLALLAGACGKIPTIPFAMPAPSAASGTTAGVPLLSKETISNVLSFGSSDANSRAGNVAKARYVALTEGYMGKLFDASSDIIVAFSGAMGAASSDQARPVATAYSTHTLLATSIAAATLHAAVLAVPLCATPDSSVRMLEALQRMLGHVKQCKQLFESANGGNNATAASTSPQMGGGLVLITELKSALQGSLAALAAVMATTPIPPLPSALRHTSISLLETFAGTSIAVSAPKTVHQLPARWQEVLAQANEWKDGTNVEARVGNEAFQTAMNLVACVATHLSSASNPSSTLSTPKDSQPNAAATNDDMKAAIVAIRPIRRVLIAHRDNASVINQVTATCVCLLSLTPPYTRDDPPWGANGWASTHNVRNVLARSATWPSSIFISSSVAMSPSKGPSATGSLSRNAPASQLPPGSPVVPNDIPLPPPPPIRTPTATLSPTSGGPKGTFGSPLSSGISARGRWARALRLYRIARLLGELHIANERLSLQDTVTSVLTPLFNPDNSSSITAAAIAAATDKPTFGASIVPVVANQLQTARSYSDMRASGLAYIVSTLPPLAPHEEIATTLNVLVGVLEKRLSEGVTTQAHEKKALPASFHFASGVVGASTLAKVQRYFYAIIRFAMADHTLRHLLPTLLGAALKPNDFSLYASLRLSKRLMDECSLFAPDTGLLRDESATEKTHRLAIYERHKLIANSIAPPSLDDIKPEPRSAKEEERARSWRLLVSLGVSCGAATSVPSTELLASHGFLATRMLLDDYFEAISSELDKCAEYAKNFYYPSQERVSEQIATLCNLVSGVAKLLPEGRFCRHAIVCAAQLAGIALMPMLPTHPSNLSELCVRAAGDVICKSNPAQCNKFFAAVSPSLPVPETIIANRDATVSALVGLALRCSCGVEGYTTGHSGAAMATLVRLATLPRWSASIDRLASSLSANIRIAASPEMSDATKREHLLSVLVVATALCGFPSVVPAVGAEVLLPDDTVAAIVEISQLNGTCTTVQLPLSFGYPEVETPLHHIRSPLSVAGLTSGSSPMDLDKLFHGTSGLTARRAESLDAALLTLSLEWAALVTSPAGAAAAMYMVRLATIAAVKDPTTTVRWARSGILRRIHDSIATKSVLTPVPFNHLDELSSVYLSTVFRPQRQLFPSGLSVPGGFQATDTSANVVPRAALQRMSQQLLVPTSEAPIPAIAALSPKRFISYKNPRTREPANVLLFAHHVDAAVTIVSEPTLITDPSQSTGIPRRPFPALPPLTSGLTIEVTLFLSDAGSHIFVNTGPPCPKPSSALKIAFDHRVVSLAAPSNPSRALLSLELKGDCIQFGVPHMGNYASAPLRARDYDRWVHLVGLATAKELVIFRDGELCASIPHFDKALMADIQPCMAIIGRRNNESNSTSNAHMTSHQAPQSIQNGIFMIGGLRLWGFALQGHLLQSINDVFRGDGGLPHVTLSDSQCTSFRFQEGSGGMVVSDNGEHFGHLSGAVRWAPQRDIFPYLPDNSPSTDFVELETVPSVGRTEAMEIPRRDLAAYLDALEPPGAGVVVMHGLLSLATHYARRCISKAVCLLASIPARVVLADSLDADRESLALVGAVLPINDLVSSVANLLRYSETDTVEDPETLRTFANLVCRVLRNESILLPADALADIIRRQFNAAMAILKEESEDFTVELPYCASTLGDVVAPLLVMNGGLRSFSSDDGRHMDSLALFGDRSHKYLLARAPDSSGFWSEVALVHHKWLYARPLCSVKYSNAVFSLKARTLRHQIAATLIVALISEGTARSPEWLDAVFDQQIIRSLTFLLESNKSATRRPEVLEVLSAIYQSWKHFPTRQPFDQAPVRMTLDRVLHTVNIAIRKGTPSSTAFENVLSPVTNTHATHIQLGTSLIVAAIECEEAWRKGAISNKISFATANLHSYETCCQAFLDTLNSYYSAHTTMAGLPMTKAPTRVLMNAANSPSVTRVGQGTIMSNPAKRRGNGVLACHSERMCTLKSTVGVRRGGRFYCEVRINDNITSPLSIGVVTEEFKGFGMDCAMGQCPHSWSFDGGRLCRIHKGVKSDFPVKPKWKPGDVIGLKVDMEELSVSCLLNNKVVSSFENIDLGASPSGIVYPALSFASTAADVVDVNFGAAPFMYDVPTGFAPLDIGGYFTVCSLTIPACVGMARYGTIVASAVATAKEQYAAELKKAQQGDENEEDYSLSVPKLQLPRVTVPTVRNHSTEASTLDTISTLLQAPGRKGPPTVRFHHFESRTVVMTDTMAMLTTPSLLRGNVTITSGKWYYEIVIDQEGSLCVGWASRPYFDNIKSGKVTVGEDPHSWVLDGTNMVLRYNRTQRNLGRQRWRVGDVIGVLLDCEKASISFTINGQQLRDLHDAFGRTTNLPNVPCSQGLIPILFGASSTAFIRSCASHMEFFPTGSEGLGVLPIGCEDFAWRFAMQRFDIASHNTSNNNDSDETMTVVDLDAALKARDSLLDLTEASSTSALLDIPATIPTDPIYNDTYITHSERAFLFAIESFQNTLAPYYGSMSLSSASNAIGNGVLRVASVSSAFGSRNNERLFGFDRPVLFGAADALKRLSFPVNGLTHLRMCLHATEESGQDSVRLTIDRRKGLMARTIGNKANRFRSSIFGQLVTALGDKATTNFFSRSGKLWSVVFTGEGADDVGGPYRECLTGMCEELMSTIIPLFVPTPNNANNVGEARDKFTLNPKIAGPSSTVGSGPSSNTVATYVFLGRLIGGCLRSGEPLALNLPPSLWQSLLGERPSLSLIDENGLDPIAYEDASYCESLRYLARLAAKDTLSDEDVQEVLEGGFTSFDVSGNTVELFPGGAQVQVTAKLLTAYVELARQHRVLHENAAARAALLSGFHSVVPPHAMAHIGWRELERIVCGQPDFDVDAIIDNAKLENISSSDPRIRYLRNILKAFSPKQRSMFARFVSGRERLPPTLKLKIMHNSNADGSEDSHLPTASTCFYYVSLPPFSSQEAMKNKLIFAITQCLDIDADFVVRDGAGVGGGGGGVDPPMVEQRSAIVQNDDDEFEDYSHLI